MQAHRVRPSPSRPLLDRNGEAGRGGLLLVLLFVLQLCHTRPIDFVCSAEARITLNIVKTLQNEMKLCGGSETLPVPVQLPCTRVHKASWDKKTFQQKGALVLASLLVLEHAAGSVRNKTALRCQRSILRLLKHNVHNHVLILRDLNIQEAPGPPEDGCQNRNVTSFNKMLNHYVHVQRHLELLVKDLRSSCS